MLGMDAKFYLGDINASIDEMNEVDNIKDLKLTMGKSTVDISTRGGARTRMKVGTLKEISVEFQMMWNNEDTYFNILRDAYSKDTEVSAAILTGSKTENGSQGPIFNWIVSKLDRDESLESNITADVTLEPSSVNTTNEEGWMEVGAS
jgi:hypothetical protein